MVIAISTDKVERDNGQLLCSTFCEGVLMLFVLGGQGGYTKINPGGVSSPECKGTIECSQLAQ